MYISYLFSFSFLSFDFCLGEPIPEAGPRRVGLTNSGDRRRDHRGKCWILEMILPLQERNTEVLLDGFSGNCPD